MQRQSGDHLKFCQVATRVRELLWQPTREGVHFMQHIRLVQEDETEGAAHPRLPSKT